MKQFNLTNYNADRFDEAQPHRDAGFRWGNISLLLGVPVIALWPINHAVDDTAWSIALAALSIVGATFQIFAFVKSIRAHRRANKILGW